MSTYVDLNTLHNPATNVAAPASWGDQVRDNDEALAKPYRCRVRRTTAHPVGSSTPTYVVWDTQDYDTSPLGDLWTPGGGTNDRFIIPVAGVWSFKFNALFAANATGARILSIILETPGRALGALHGSGSAAWFWGGTVSGEDYLAAGSVVKFFAYQTSGVTLNLVLDAEMWASARLVSR